MPTKILDLPVALQPPWFSSAWQQEEQEVLQVKEKVKGTQKQAVIVRFYILIFVPMFYYDWKLQRFAQKSNFNNLVPVQELWFLVTKVTVCTFKIWIDLCRLLST